MYFLVKLLVNTLALLLLVKIIPGIKVADWQSALFAALALGVVNAVIRPVLLILTLPLNLLTLGLFTFVVNAALFYSVSRFVPGFEIAGFVTAFFGSLVFSLISSVLSFIAAPSSVRIFRYHSGKRKDAIDVEGRQEEDKS